MDCVTQFEFVACLISLLNVENIELTYKCTYNLLMMVSVGTYDLDHVTCLLIVHLFLLFSKMENNQLFNKTFSLF